MKILYITPSLYIPGGVERVLTLKMNWLAQHTGWEIHVVLTDGKDKEPYYPLDPRINVTNLDIGFEELWHLPFIKKIPVYLKKQVIYRKKLKKVLFDVRPDITDSLLRREINFITAIKDGSVKIGEHHVNRKHAWNFEEADTSPLKELFSKFWTARMVRNLRKLDRFIVLSNEDSTNWPELDNVSVIHNPVPYIPDTPSPAEGNTVIAVGRYAYQKGFDLLLKAWAEVAPKHPDWKLEVWGGGERGPYLDLSASLGLQESVSLNPSTTEIYDKYMKAGIFVLSSRFEGFPMVLLEALGFGLPIVAFTCPCGVKDCITDGENGLTAPAEDVDALARQLDRMMSDPQGRRAMAARARETAERYRIDAIMSQWVDLFTSLAKKHGKVA